MNLHLLRDPWIPLVQEKKVHLVTLRQLLIGEEDAPDLQVPWDSLRVAGHMLLSALAQFLFPPGGGKEIRQRLSGPMPASEVDPVLERWSTDPFLSLLGDGSFMQSDSGTGDEDDTERLLLDLSPTCVHVLIRDEQPRVGLSLPTAVLAAYALQAFAPPGGRGFYASVRGGSPVTTLIRRESVREMMWANTLCPAALSSWPKEPPTPWARGGGQHFRGFSFAARGTFLASLELPTASDQRWCLRGHWRSRAPGGGIPLGGISTARARYLLRASNVTALGKGGPRRNGCFICSEDESGASDLDRIC